MPQFDLTRVPTQIFWLVVCFAVLYFLMAKAVLPKIGATIESREHKIQADLDAAQKANDAARAAGVEQDKALAEARGQASGLIREASEAAAAQTSAKLHEVSDRLGAEIVAAEKRIGEQRKVTADGTFSWLEVECLGACVNAPVVQINDDFFEDLDEASLKRVLDALKRGENPKPGPQVDRINSAPEGGPTTLRSE